MSNKPIETEDNEVKLITRKLKSFSPDPRNVLFPTSSTNFTMEALTYNWVKSFGAAL